MRHLRPRHDNKWPPNSFDAVCGGRGATGRLWHHVLLGCSLQIRLGTMLGSDRGRTAPRLPLDPRQASKAPSATADACRGASANGEGPDGSPATAIAARTNGIGSGALRGGGAVTGGNGDTPPTPGATQPPPPPSRISTARSARRAPEPVGIGGRAGGASCKTSSGLYRRPRGCWGLRVSPWDFAGPFAGSRGMLWRLRDGATRSTRASPQVRALDIHR